MRRYSIVWLTVFVGGWCCLHAQTATQILDQTTKTYAQLQSLRMELKSAILG